MSIFSSFFASAWYLLFLPLTLLPIVIYLFNRRKNRKISFSSNFFLKKVESSSIRKINIINILLLVIRTLLILFFILMLAKPKNLFVSNELDFSSTAKIYIYVDDTYSMNDEIKTRLFETINSIFKLHNTDDYAEIIYLSYNNVIFNDQIKLFDSNVLNESAAFISNIFINPSDFISNDDLSFENKFFYIVGDAKYADDSSIIDYIPDGYSLTYVNINNDKVKNLSIVNAKVENQFYEIYEPISINAKILNESNTKAENVLIQLFVNDIARAEQILNIEPNESKIVNFSITLMDTGENLAYFKLHDTKIQDDDYYYMNFPINENLELAMIGDDNDLLISNAINYGLNFRSKIININKYNSINSFMMNNKREDVIILNGVEYIKDDLFDYIKNMFNKKVILIISPSLNDTKLNNLNSTYVFQNTLDKSEFISLNNTDCEPNNWFSFRNIEKSSIQNFYLKELYRDDQRLFKINKYLKIPTTDNTIISIDDGNAFLNQYFEDNMTIYFFTVSLNENINCISSSEFGLKGSFLPFVNYLISGLKVYPNYFVGDDFAINNYTNSSELEIINPYKEKNIVNIADKDAYTFTYPGMHTLKYLENTSHLAVNIDSLEFLFPSLSNDYLLDILPLNSQIASNVNEISLLDKSSEYRYIFLIIVIFLFVLELLLSNYIIRVNKNA